MRRLSKRFYGTLDQLDGIIRATGSVGTWEEMPGYVRFKSTDDSILNWWPTGTFNFQGPPAAREAFERAFVAVIYGDANGRLALPSPRDEG